MKKNINSTPQESGFLRRNWKVGALIGIALIIVGWQIRIPLWNLILFTADQENFGAFIRGYGAVGPIVLASLQFLQILLAVLPGHALTLAGGYIYGLVLGFLFNLFVIVAASQLAFGIARYFGRHVVVRLAPAAMLNRWDGAARRYGFAFFFTSFLFPIFPADTMNYLAGLTSLSGKKFLVASVLGRAPATFLMTWMGAQGVSLVTSSGLPWWAWAYLIVGAFALYLAWRLAPRFGAPRVE